MADLTVEQLADNQQIVRWVTNTYLSQKRWHMTDGDVEHIRTWAQESGPDRVRALYERCDSVSVAEFESLLGLSMGVGNG